ncbi:MAG: polyprenol monophosphomannose synthase [Actinomycetota bacterium]|nr:polyprenol monophosphomannose synthase [Actinomycetota bacterium]
MSRLLVLPTFQEAANIVKVLEAVRQADADIDVLVIDDSSPDGTADLAQKAGVELGGIEVLSRPSKSGLGTAYRTGFTWGLERGYEILVEMDADLSHDPADLPRLISGIEAGHDLMIGSRYVPGGSIPEWSWYRRALSAWGNRYTAKMLALEVSDATSGFRAYRGAVLAMVDLTTLMADGYGFQIEMVRQMAAVGARIGEIPISFTDRAHGKSKMSGAIVIEALRRVTWWGITDRLRRARHKHGSLVPADPRKR